MARLAFAVLIAVGLAGCAAGRPVVQPVATAPRVDIEALLQAIQCYDDLSITVRRKAIDDIRAGAGSEAAKAGLIARHERAIVEATSQRDEAARDVATVEKSP